MRVPVLDEHRLPRVEVVRREAIAQYAELFDAVVTNDAGEVREIQVKQRGAASSWIWGAFKMPGTIYHDLYRLWCERERRDEYVGTLINAYLAGGGRAMGVRAGQSYVDVGTLNGYREAIKLLSTRPLMS